MRPGEDLLLAILDRIGCSAGGGIIRAVLTFEVDKVPTIEIESRVLDEQGRMQLNADRTDVLNETRRYRLVPLDDDC